MKKMLMLSVLLVSALFASAAQYIENKPLDQMVTVAVGPVKPGQMQLPVITWGGDIATLLGNGGAVTTQPGSVFASQKLNFKMVREDVFPKQIESYVSGQSAYLRGTVGMINQSLSALKDPRVRPVVIYQMTWSQGGDVLVVRSSVKDAADLKGKTIVVQAYGPHVDFLVQTLADAGVALDQVKLKWVKDITGTDNSPAAAFRSDPSIDAAFVISPDASELTGGVGKIGNGKEKTVNGARMLMSTKSADKVIADVYAVRADYLQEHKAEVESFVHALMSAQEQLELLSRTPAQKANYDKLMSSAALVFLDSKDAIDDAKGLYGDCSFAGFAGNMRFFRTPAYPRRFDVVSSENQTSLVKLGLLNSRLPLTSAEFDYEKLKAGLRNTTVEAEMAQFDPAMVAALVAKKGDQLNAIFTFSVKFEPNMAQFDVSGYVDDFQKVISLASTYSGAILTVEGHTDPNKYLQALRANIPQVELKQIRQVNMNTSLNRANQVRAELVAFAKSKGVVLDESQITTLGHGCFKPVKGVEMSGVRKGEPLPSLTEQEWRNNMRVQFRIVGVEAEDGVFSPVK